MLCVCVCGARTRIYNEGLFSVCVCEKAEPNPLRKCILFCQWMRTKSSCYPFSSFVYLRRHDVIVYIALHVVGWSQIEFWFVLRDPWLQHFFFHFILISQHCWKIIKLLQVSKIFKVAIIIICYVYVCICFETISYRFVYTWARPHFHLLCSAVCVYDKRVCAVSCVCVCVCISC